MELSTRAGVERLQAALGALPQVDVQTSHVLAGGIYARSITVPAGASLVGATHKRDHITVMQGDITVWNEGVAQRYTGSHTFPTKAGAKRAVYAHADTVWTTLCRTDETELEAIEADLVEDAEHLQTRGLIGCAPLQSIEG